MKYLVTGGSGFIGTNLIEFLESNNAEILNIDFASPRNKTHQKYWSNCDIRNKELLLKNFKSFNPDYVVHLAARCDADGKTLEDYNTNILGSRNVAVCCNETASVKRLIVTSTQFVHRDKQFPKDDLDYKPYTLYGESKMHTEIVTRGAELKCIWTIVRPTNIWGHWSYRHLDFWRLVRKGMYIHPGKQPVMRTFGFVDTIVYQLNRILELEAAKVNGQVFYLGDGQLDLVEWANLFSNRIIKRNIIIVPRPVIYAASLAGTILNKAGIKFPISLYRYKHLTNSDCAPIDKTLSVLGRPDVTLAVQVNNTVNKLHITYPEEF